MNSIQYIDHAWQHMYNNPQKRFGIALFDALKEVAPSVAEGIVGTSDDPWLATTAEDIANFMELVERELG